jgi:hypothetical protein
LVQGPADIATFSAAVFSERPCADEDMMRVWEAGINGEIVGYDGRGQVAVWMQYHDCHDKEGFCGNLRGLLKIQPLLQIEGENRYFPLHARWRSWLKSLRATHQRLERLLISVPKAMLLSEAAECARAVGLMPAAVLNGTTSDQMREVIFLFPHRPTGKQKEALRRRLSEWHTKRDGTVRATL